MLPTKFQLIWPNGFREDFFNLPITNKNCLVVRTARNMEIVYRSSNTSFLQSKLFNVPPSFRGEDFKNFTKSEKKIGHCDHVSSNRDKKRISYRGPSIDAACKILLI